MNSNEIVPLETIRQPPSADFDFDTFLSVGFSGHVEIMAKVKDVEEYVYYLKAARNGHWTKVELREHLKADDYHHVGALPNNFVATIDTPRRALAAVKMFKDEYLLDFVNVEDIEATSGEDVDERVIETAIVANIKNFIMTFGRGFTFNGSQVHFDKLGHDHWIDLLFYNRDLRRLVVFELKKGRFKTAYLAQLSTYLRILNDDDRREGEEPPIGIILCKSADKAYVEYIMQDFRQPMGVATYKTADEMDAELMNVLPSKEQLEKLLE